MKIRSSLLLGFVFVTVGLGLRAQGTAFTYQGKLDNNDAPVSGNYDFRFRLAADANGDTYVGSAFLTNAVPVNGGLFVATIDFGPGYFNGTNYWLEVDVRTNGAGGYTALFPLQKFTPTPYAIFANTASNLAGGLPASQLNGQLTGTQIANGAVSALQIDNNAVQSRITGSAPAGQFITGIAANGSVTTAPDTSDWKLNGNTISPGQFLGSLNQQPLEFQVGGQRAMRYEFGGLSAYLAKLGVFIPTGAPNVIGGASINYVAEGVVGATIGGGGTTNYFGSSYTNSVAADFGVVGGGFGNSIQTNAYYSFIGGGFGNSIQTNAFKSVLVGGEANSIQTSADRSFIGGGFGNSIQSNANVSVLGGGYNNSIQANAVGSVLGGGANNSIQTGATESVLSGGDNNSIQIGAYESFLGGGHQNSIGSNSYGSVLVGGQNNQIANDENSAFLGGGNNNLIGAYATYPVLNGGVNNTMQSGYASVLGGGYNNTMQPAVSTSVLGGGSGNTIQFNNSYSVLGGGYNNTIQSNILYATLGGGVNNTNGANYSTVPGGFGNYAGSQYSFAAGYNAKATNSGAFVWSDGSGTVTGSGTTNSVTMRASGGFRFLTTSGNVGASLASGGTSWAVISDQNVKKNFTAVDYLAVLDKLARVPVERWNYNWEKDGDVPNIGPMAQAFKAAFYPGRDDKSITTLEFDGVELAAIQGLNQKLGEKDAQIQALKARNDALEKRLDSLAATVETLTEKK